VTIAYLEVPIEGKSDAGDKVTLNPLKIESPPPTPEYMAVLDWRGIAGGEFPAIVNRAGAKELSRFGLFDTPAVLGKKPSLSVGSPSRTSIIDDFEGADVGGGDGAAVRAGNGGEMRRRADETSAAAEARADKPCMASMYYIDYSLLRLEPCNCVKKSDWCLH
jgi:hypothetical protein